LSEKKKREGNSFPSGSKLICALGLGRSGRMKAGKEVGRSEAGGRRQGGQWEKLDNFAA